MIREFLCFVLLVCAFVGAATRLVWLKSRKNSSGEAQSIDRDEGRLPDSFFDSCTPDSPNERKDELLAVRKNKCEFRR
jgi:hypothetical protein